MPSVPKELKGLIPPQRVHKKKKRKNITPSQREQFKKEFLEKYREDDAKLSATAEEVGFSRQVIYKWAETDSEFAQEFERLRFIKKNKSQEEWDKEHKNDEEYKAKFLELYSDDSYSVASALKEVSKKLKRKDLDYWVKSDFEFKKKYKALQKKLRPALARSQEIHKSIASVELQEKQKQFLELFRKNHFNVTKTAELMGVTRATVKDWGRKDPDFAAQIKALNSEKIDYMEDKLFTLIDEGNAPATIFGLKCGAQERDFGRENVYIEQPQRIEGHVQHDHMHSFNQEQLDALVRGKQIDRGKYEDMLQLNDPNVIDAEYSEESSINDVEAEIKNLESKLAQLKKLKTGK